MPALLAFVLLVVVSVLVGVWLVNRFVLSRADLYRRRRVELAVWALALYVVGVLSSYLVAFDLTLGVPPWATVSLAGSALWLTIWQALFCLSLNAATLMVFAKQRPSIGRLRRIGIGLSTFWLAIAGAGYLAGPEIVVADSAAPGQGVAKLRVIVYVNGASSVQVNVSAGMNPGDTVRNTSAMHVYNAATPDGGVTALLQAEGQPGATIPVAIAFQGQVGDEAGIDTTGLSQVKVTRSSSAWPQLGAPTSTECVPRYSAPPVGPTRYLLGSLRVGGDGRAHGTFSLDDPSVRWYDEVADFNRVALPEVDVATALGKTCTYGHSAAQTWELPTTGSVTESLFPYMSLGQEVLTDTSSGTRSENGSTLAWSSADENNPFVKPAFAIASVETRQRSLSELFFAAAFLGLAAAALFETLRDAADPLSEPGATKQSRSRLLRAGRPIRVRSSGLRRRSSRR